MLMNSLTKKFLIVPINSDQTVIKVIRITEKFFNTVKKLMTNCFLFSIGSNHKDIKKEHQTVPDKMVSLKDFAIFEDYLNSLTPLEKEQQEKLFAPPNGKETFEWLKKNFPEEESLRNFLKYSSSGLNQDKIFPVWTGR